MQGEKVLVSWCVVVLVVECVLKRLLRRVLRLVCVG
jgi:hypothetical protein